MGKDPAGDSKPYDPLEPFRGMRDAYLEAMAKTMVEAVNTETYAQATGAMLESALTMSAPFREVLEKTMLQVVQQLSLPSRQDIVALAERFTNFEMRLDDLDAKLDRLAKPPNGTEANANDNSARPVEANSEAKSVTPAKAKAPVVERRAEGDQKAPSHTRAGRKGIR